MTVFGKLLVFMNLVFAVVTGALIIFVFTTRASWHTAYVDAKQKAEAAEAAYKVERASHENDVKQKDSEIKSSKDEVTRVTNELQASQADNQRLTKAAADQKNLTDKATTDQTAVQAELKQLKQERDDIVKEKDDLRNRIVSMQKEIDSWRNTAVN